MRLMASKSEDGSGEGVRLRNDKFREGWLFQGYDETSAG